MRFGRVVRLALLLAPVAWGVGQHATASHAQLRSSLSAQPAISAPHQSLPRPIHDEATCAFCQAAVFSPHGSPAPAIVPATEATVRRTALSPGERIPHFESSQPASSRAPPLLSLA